MLTCLYFFFFSNLSSSSQEPEPRVQDDIWPNMVYQLSNQSARVVCTLCEGTKFFGDKYKSNSDT